MIIYASFQLWTTWIGFTTAALEGPSVFALQATPDKSGELGELWIAITCFLVQISASLLPKLPSLLSTIARRATEEAR
ncbi:MAG: hypothetical protein EA353_10925 [Puniceicoccaceae bacterium]|nr:MAG: hypothetical protein EA353_10925 [Puniceicoccaceae bacterium]